MKKSYLIVNFGGPRHQGEIASFLQELLTDRDLIRTRWPQYWHNWLFSRIAKKRFTQVAHDYQKIGGGSPIYADTEEVASRLRSLLGAPVLVFHRYLTATHADFIREIEALQCQEIDVFPMFPQFSYATTGSIARWLDTHLSLEKVQSMRWSKSYAVHPAFVQATQELIRGFLKSQSLDDSEIFLLFSAHGLPCSFIHGGDPYAIECQRSFAAVGEGFPEVPSLLSYQSQFGRGKWLRPSTLEISSSIAEHNHEKRAVVIVPISFTSDHIETLFEIEYQYLPLIRGAGMRAYRCPALGLGPSWIQAISEIVKAKERSLNDSLIWRA